MEQNYFINITNEIINNLYSDNDLKKKPIVKAGEILDKPV